MTIGPEPMTRMCAMSVRFGIRLLPTVTFLGSALAPLLGPPLGVPPLAGEALRCSLAVAFEQLNEPIEEIRRVVRSGRGLRVVLHAERARVAGSQTLDHVVVKAHVAHLDGPELGIGRAVQRRVDREAVIVRGDLDLAGHAVLHRLVDAAMAVAELVGAEAVRTTEHLVAEADAEDRHLAA